MKKRGEVADRIKEMRLQLGMEQVPFARLLKASQSRVSQWESGKGEPSAEMYVRLASRAGPEQAIWFLERAGLTRETLRVLAGELMAAPRAGKIIELPRVELLDHELKPSGSPVLLSRDLVPHPASTIAFDAPLGQLLLVDTSVTRVDALMGTWVVVDSSAPAEPPISARPAGLVMGQLDLEHEGRERSIAWYAVVRTSLTGAVRIAGWEEKVARLRPAEARVAILSKQETRSTPRDILKQWRITFAREMELLRPGLPKRQRKAIGKLKLFRGCRILGRVFAQIYLRG